MLLQNAVNFFVQISSVSVPTSIVLWLEIRGVEQSLNIGAIVNLKTARKTCSFHKIGNRKEIGVKENNFHIRE